MKKTTLIAAVTALVATSVVIAQATGDAERGKQAYYDYACYGCHGYGGIGRHDIANQSSGVMVNEQVFLLYLRARGNQNPAFSTQTMPHYPASSLSDEDALDIYAYIMTLVDDPPPVEDIPALQGILDDAKSE
ncbi:MAG: c-type cytochrome [Woeseiaceae bacterium]|nr:c-type cytochrome [Woeseiaceae bacterium]